jgi:proline racemase
VDRQADGSGADARNAVFYGDKAIDRSPWGTGTAARMAQLHAKGKLKAGDAFVHESIIGSLFKGKVEKEVTVAGKPAIIPSIGGWARMTGLNTIFIDDRDPFAHGFVVNDRMMNSGTQMLKRILLYRRNDPPYHLILTAISSKSGA